MAAGRFLGAVQVDVLGWNPVCIVERAMSTAADRILGSVSTSEDALWRVRTETRIVSLSRMRTRPDGRSSRSSVLRMKW
jgi:hypothetical protein